MILCRLEVDWAVEQWRTCPQYCPVHSCAWCRGHPRWAKGPCKALLLTSSLGFPMSRDKHQHGNKGTPPLPTSCETAPVLAYSMLPRFGENTFEKVGGKKEKKRWLSQPWERGQGIAVAGSLVLHTAQSVIPICWSRMPSFSWHHCCQKPPPPFSIWRQGKRYCDSVNSSCPKA